jgi:hypothetical protein
MFAFPQIPSGHRSVLPLCMPNTSYTMRDSLTASSRICGERKGGFFKSKLDSALFIDDPNKKSADHRAKFYLMPTDPAKNEMHPPGVHVFKRAYDKVMKFSAVSIFNFTTQVVPQSLPSRDAYKTFICKGLFTTTHAIQKGSMMSHMVKANLEPLVTWYRAYFERFQLPDRNSMPGSTGIGLASSLRTLSMKLISSSGKYFAGIYSNFIRYCYFSFFSTQCGLKSFHQDELFDVSANFKPIFTPMM